jgi:dipeptidyl aminopeptidase/acylaminoacyl peptidase
MSRTLTSFGVILALVAPAAADAQSRPVTKLRLEQFFDMETVSNPRISPDGTQIIYTRGWVDKVNDRRQSDMWIMNADGSKNRVLTEGSGAVWSPDGTRIAFTRQGEPRGSQIFVRWMDAEGAESQITRLDSSPSSITWTPDGRSILFTMNIPERRSWPIQMPSRPPGATWTEGPRIIESLSYRADRRGFVDQTHTHIFIVPAEGGTARQITTGPYSYGGFSLTPDGRDAIFSGNRDENRERAEREYRQSDVWALNIETGALRRLTDRSGPDTSPTVSPDGRWIAYLGYDYTTDTYIDNELYVVGTDGRNPRHMTATFDRSPANLTWAPDSNGIYFAADDSGTRNLHYAPLDGAIRAVTTGTHLVNLSDVNKSGQAVGTITSFHRPGDIVSFPLSDPSNVRQLTHVNEDVLGTVTLGEVEEIWYDSLDSYKVQGWLIKPPDFDPSKKYPLMLSIHGGPHSMYGVGFNFAWQEHAANGYLVLYTNPRGSTGYGSAFGNAIKYAYPSKDFDDLMKGVDTVVAKGYVDERNLFVYGCSGGGVLTAWVVGHTDRFAAAASQCPVINWISFVGNVDGNPLRWYEDFEKFPWEDPSEHLRRSPLMYIGNVKTPTMLMTGVLDMRTPISQTEEFYQALKAVGVPTAMLRFNNEWHGTSSTPSNFLRTQLYLRYWWEKWTTKDEPAGRGLSPLGVSRD